MPKAKSWKGVLVAVLAVLAVLGVLAGVKAAQIGAMIEADEELVPPPIAVTTAPVEVAEWEATWTAVGTVVPIQGVVVSSEVSGKVNTILFDSGAQVNAGDVLVRLDASIERAQRASAQAEATLARQEAKRSRSLRATNSLSQAALEQAEARAAQAEAALQNIDAVLLKKTIQAPFSGRLGIRRVNLGEVLAPGTPIVSLQSLDPIYVEFTLPEQAVAQLAAGQLVRASADPYPDRTWEGAIAVVDPVVDRETRNVRVRATVANADERLRPGMFVNIAVVQSERRRVIMIPSSAVLYAPYGDSVFVVEGEVEGETPVPVKQIFVRLGERRGDYVEVVRGVDPGVHVVSTGAFKLQNGMRVIVRNELAPDTSLTPTPGNR